jgi:hypothetical protein
MTEIERQNEEAIQQRHAEMRTSALDHLWLDCVLDADHGYSCGRWNCWMRSFREQVVFFALKRREYWLEIVIVIGFGDYICNSRLRPHEHTLLEVALVVGGWVFVTQYIWLWCLSEQLLCPTLLSTLVSLPTGYRIFTIGAAVSVR